MVVYDVCRVLTRERIGYDASLFQRIIRFRLSYSHRNFFYFVTMVSEFRIFIRIQSLFRLCTKL